MNGITIALSKGRIFEETLPLLAAAGIEPLENPETSRKLIIPTSRDDVRVVMFPSASHFVQHDEPAAVTAEMLAFFQT